MTVKRSILAVMVAVLCLGAAPVTPVQKDRQIQALQDRVAQLEKRVAELEKQARAATTQQTPEERRLSLRAKFQNRVRQDQRKYSPEQISEAEQLYQAANKNLGGDEAKANLEQMIGKYPDLNRTGCAVLYLAQAAKGEERETRLTEAIEKYGDCMYGDGVQVGAYARFLLANYYTSAGQAEKAKALYEQIRGEYPDAVDHHGVPLAQQMPQEVSAQ